MSNPNVKPRFKKGDPETIESAKKGGKNKLGKVSIKTELKRQLESGEIDIKTLAKSFYAQAMKGNSPYARLLMDYIDGKVKDEVEVTTTINPAAQALKDIRANLDK